MGSALREMLPYCVGLLASALPALAMIILVRTADGTRKAVVFAVTWILSAFVLTLVLTLIVSALDSRAWEGAIMLATGVALLIVAGIAYTRIRQGDHAMPRWPATLGEAPPDRIARSAALQAVTNPVNTAMLVAASVALGRRHLPAGEDLLPIAAFVVIGSLVMLAPFGFAGRPATLDGFDIWLRRNHNLLTLLVGLGFGVSLLVNGLRSLP